MSFLLAMGIVVLATAPSTEIQSLTLREALRRSAEAHPALRSAAHRADAARHRADHAARRPNPSLAGRYEDFGGSVGSGHSVASLELAQPFEIGGDRDARAGVARTATDVANAEAEALRRQILAGTGERFLEVWVLEQRVARLAAAVAAATAAESAATARTRAGAAPAFEAMRVRNFRSLRDIERRNAESELDMARRRLGLEWGADQLDAGPLQLDAPAARDIPDTTALYARLGEHPSLRAAASEAALESWRVREAKAARVPDVTVSAAVRHLAEVPGTGFAAELSLPLPLWNSGSSATTAAERERDAAIASVESARRRLREEVGAARDRCIASFETYERLRTEARPAAEEAMSQIVAAFRAGRLGYLDLQEGERSRIETDLLLAGATADVWRARLALEALIGTRLDDTKEER